MAEQQKQNGGAYSYPNAYPISSRPSRRKSRIGFCCRCICSVLIVIILLLGLASLVIYLVFRPKLPRYTVQDVKIQSLNLTRSRTVDSHITLTIRAENPNKRIGIKYRTIQSELFYGGTKLGQGSVPAFYQGKRKVTVIHTDIKGSKVPVSQSTASRLKSSESVLLSTVTKVKARIKMGKLTVPVVRLRVRCVMRVSGVRVTSRSCGVKKVGWW